MRSVVSALVARMKSATTPDASSDSERPLPIVSKPRIVVVDSFFVLRDKYPKETVCAAQNATASPTAVARRVHGSSLDVTSSPIVKIPSCHRIRMGLVIACNTLLLVLTRGLSNGLLV